MDYIISEVYYENLSNNDILNSFQEAILIKIKKEFHDKIKNGKPLKSNYISPKGDPEDYTIRTLEPLIKKYIGNIEFDSQIHKISSLGNLKKPDFLIKSKDEKINKNLLIEWEPFNEDLRVKKDHGTNQAKIWISDINIGKNHDAIVTNGMNWILITTIEMNNEIRVIEKDLTVKDAFKLMENIYNAKLTIKEPVEQGINITEKFYNWYVALIHGGEYIDKENKKKIITKEQCLLNNIVNSESEQDKEEYIRTNFVRLIFIRILTEYGLINKDVLNYLKTTKPENFYNRVNQLFFETLNTPKKERENIPKSYTEIPFLNGGLFRKKPIDLKNIKLRREAFLEAIEFLRTFHFKKEYENNEETYLIDNTIDPEILGHILEKSIEDRKESGVYYTPQLITEFMAKDTIENYIKSRVIEFLKIKEDQQWRYIENFEDLFNLDNLILKKIYEEIIQMIKICDPAVGSGAFLLSCGNKLFQIRKRILDKIKIELNDYDLKKEIIQSNLYGVDLKEQAVDICKLRLWLWIVQKQDQEPLPNIDFNIRVGNSLIGYTNIETIKINKEDISSWENKTNLIDIFLERNDLIKNYYNLNNPREQEKLKDKIDEITIKFNNNLNKAIINELKKEKVNLKQEDCANLKVFHWIMEFSEVFEKYNGFDIIIGNPPYFRITNSPKIEQSIIGKLGILKEYHHGQGDIYYDFIVRSYELLCNQGFLTFITSRYWLESAYANYLKKFLKTKISMEKIIDFREYSLFKGVDIHNSILSYIKTEPKKKENKFKVFLFNEFFLENTLEEKNLNFIEEIGDFNTVDWKENENWAFVMGNQKDLFMRIKKIKTKIGDDYNCNQYTNSFRKQYKSILTFEKIPTEIPESYLRKYRKMNEIKKYSINPNFDKYVLVIHNSNEAWNNQNLKRFLMKNQIAKEDLIEIKDDSDKNIDKFEEIVYIGYRIPRIIYNFIYNNNQTWIDNSYFITKKNSSVFSLKYVCAVLNSEFMRYYLDVIGKKKDFEIEIGAIFIKNIPIILKRGNLTKEELKKIDEIESLTQKIIDYEQNDKKFDNLVIKINELIYDLYKITEDEQEMIKKYIKETYSNLY